MLLRGEEILKRRREGMPIAEDQERYSDRDASISKVEDRAKENEGLSSIQRYPAGISRTDKWEVEHIDNLPM